MRFPFPTSPERNPVYGFLPVLPGAGATTLACMAALSLSGGKKQVALLDFSLSGKARSYMGLTPDVCPASVIDAAGVGSPDEIHRAGVIHPRSVFIIPGPARPLDMPQVDSRLVSQTLAYVRHEFDYTVVILPPLWGSGWVLALACNVICCVLKPARADLDCCREEFELLSRLGCGERMKIILNQSNAPGALRGNEVESVINPDCVLPHDPAIYAMANKRYLETPFKKQLLSLLREEG